MALTDEFRNTNSDAEKRQHCSLDIIYYKYDDSFLNESEFHQIKFYSKLMIQSERTLT